MAYYLQLKMEYDNAIRLISNSSIIYEMLSEKNPVKYNLPHAQAFYKLALVAWDQILVNNYTEEHQKTIIGYALEIIEAADNMLLIYDSDNYQVKELKQDLNELKVFFSKSKTEIEKIAEIENVDLKLILIQSEIDQVITIENPVERVKELQSILARVEEIADK